MQKKEEAQTAATVTGQGEAPSKQPHSNGSTVKTGDWMVDAIRARGGTWPPEPGKCARQEKSHKRVIRVPIYDHRPTIAEITAAQKAAHLSEPLVPWSGWGEFALLRYTEDGHRPYLARVVVRLDADGFPCDRGFEKSADGDVSSVRIWGYWIFIGSTVRAGFHYEGHIPDAEWAEVNIWPGGNEGMVA